MSAVNPFTIETAGARIHVVRAGEPSRPAIVLVHGYPDTHRVWSRQIDALSDDFHVAAFDLRGVGKSECTGGRRTHRIGQVLEDFRAVFDAVAGPGRGVHLVGHDWGGLLGWSALHSPKLRDRIQSFTAVAGPHWSVGFAWCLRNLVSLSPVRMKKAMRQLAASWYILAFQFPFLPWVFRRKPVASLCRIYAAGGLPAADPLYMELDDETARRQLLPGLALYRHNLFHHKLPAPGEIDTPVQLIIPLRDRFITPALYESLPTYATRIESHAIEAGHWVMRTHPQQVDDWIREFVYRNEPVHTAGRTAQGQEAHG